MWEEVRVGELVWPFVEGWQDVTMRALANALLSRRFICAVARLKVMSPRGPPALVPDRVEKSRSVLATFVAVLNVVHVLVRASAAK